MEDGDAVWLDAMDQTIGMHDQFARARIIVLGHDAPGVWMLNQLFDAPGEFVDRLSRIKRIVLDEQEQGRSKP